MPIFKSCSQNELSSHFLTHCDPVIDTCTKTAFSFNNQLYEQVDGVSMGGSLGPLLANIIMVELEAKVIRPLIDDGTIKFYTRFVDDTLLLITAVTKYDIMSSSS